MTTMEYRVDVDHMVTRQSAYQILRGAARHGDDTNAELFARMLASQRAGMGGMPERLGLSRRQYATLMGRYFPGIPVEEYGRGPALEVERAPEREDLRVLFIGSLPGLPREEHYWIADIVIAGCMGGDHLWQDLGLWSRKDVSELLQHNFPQLAARNDRDMKWKKFLYKQLCNAEGVYTCRAPSCEVCDDFQSCFGDED